MTVDEALTAQRDEARAELAQARLDHQSEVDALRVERTGIARGIAAVTAELAASEALVEAALIERSAAIEQAATLSARLDAHERGSAMDSRTLHKARAEVERLKAEAATAAERQQEADALNIHASWPDFRRVVRATPLVTTRVKTCAACAHLPEASRGLASCGCGAEAGR